MGVGGGGGRGLIPCRVQATTALNSIRLFPFGILMQNNSAIVIYLSSARINPLNFLNFFQSQPTHAAPTAGDVKQMFTCQSLCLHTAKIQYQKF